MLGDALGRILVDNHVYMKEQEVKKTGDLKGATLGDFYVYFI